MNKNFYNNTSFKFGIYPRESYNKNITTSQFTEFSFDDKPLYKSSGDITKSLYSVMNTGEFKNGYTVVLDNPVVKHIVGIDDVRETSLYTHYLIQGIDLKKDYVFRLWKDDGLTKEVFHTGVAIDIKQTEKEIILTIDSRLNQLKYLVGESIKTELAGVPENTRFNTSLEIVTDESDVEYEGDIEVVDYAETENEGDLDLRGFKNSIGTFYRTDEEVYISNVAIYDKSEFGTKYNYVYDDIDAYSNPDIVHYHFKRTADSKFYNVVEKVIDAKERVGQWTKLYLVEDGTTNYEYMGIGRVPENLNDGANDDGEKINSLEGFYIKDTAVDSVADVDISYYNGCYHYFNDQESSSNEYTGFMGQIVVKDGYYLPLFQYSINFQANSHFNESRNKPRLFKNTVLSNDDEGYDVFGTDTQVNLNDNTGLMSVSSKTAQNESTKSRAYFMYNESTDTVVFQRASDSAPVASADVNISKTVGTVINRNWSNFGVNPIGYYRMSDNKLGYLNKTNDDFIYDWIYDNSTNYMVMSYPEKQNYDTSFYYTIFEMTTGGTMFNLGGGWANSANSELDPNAAHGLHYYNKSGIDYLSWVYERGGHWYYNRTDLAILYSSDLTNLGLSSQYSSPTGSAIIGGHTVMLIFKNNKMQYRFIFGTLPNIDYVAEKLTNKYGGYIVTAKATDDFTAKIQDNIVTFHSQMRFSVLDFTDKTLLQALMMLVQASNKFAYIDNRDVLVIKDKANVVSSGETIERTVKNTLKLLDSQTYKSLSINAFDFDKNKLFEWSLNRGEYLHTVDGVFYGRDCAMTIKVKVITDDTIDYWVYSSSDILETPKTRIGVADWSDINIAFGDDFAKLLFRPDRASTGVAPDNGTVFNCVFKNRVMEKTTDVFKANYSDGDKTKTIDNKLITPDIGLIYKADVEPLFNGAKKVFEVEIPEVLNDYDLTKTIFFNCYYFNEALNCYIQKLKLTKKGTTSLYLVEV